MRQTMITESPDTDENHLRTTVSCRFDELELTETSFTMEYDKYARYEKYYGKYDKWDESRFRWDGEYPRHTENT